MQKSWRSENDSLKSKQKTVTKDNGTLLEINNVCKTYDSVKTNFTPLKNINLTIQPKEFTAIIGKSGCGKSTILNLIAGIDSPSAGEIIEDHRSGR